MWLVAGPSPEFIKFIQILCWIVLPALAIVVLATVVVHYRNKRKAALSDGRAVKEKLLHATPERVGYTSGDGKYILFDHSKLILEYKNRLTYSHARITALEGNLVTMETKYAALACYVGTNLVTTKKTSTMENVQEKMPESMQSEINKVIRAKEAEKSELLAKLEQLERSYQRLEQENKTLQEQLDLGTATEDEKILVINKWREENNVLREKIAGQEYLEDLLQEKKAQIIFLQNQLEQRIKDLYRSEHQRLQTVAELKQLKEEQERNINASQSELLLRQEQADKIQVVLCEKEEQLAARQELINDKTNHITVLENVLREAKEQNEQLNAALADSRDQLDALQQQLSDEQSRTEFTEQKISGYQKLFWRLHKELSGYTDDESKGSQVIALRPEYSEQANEETAV